MKKYAQITIRKERKCEVTACNQPILKGNQAIYMGTKSECTFYLDGIKRPQIKLWIHLECFRKYFNG